VRDLRRQQEEREAQKYLKDLQRERNSRLQVANEKLVVSQEAANAENTKLVALQGELQRSGALWHIFKRRKLKNQIESQKALAMVAASDLRDAEAVLEAIHTENAAEYPGLSLESRRAINLAVIAYAQILCEKLSAGGLCARAKEAVARRVQEMKFGTRGDCEAQMTQIQKSLASLGAARESAAAIKSICDRLRAVCQYRNESDTVPSAESIANAQIDNILQGGKGPISRRCDVLADDYWDLYTVLLR
jgi:hypothetical protein